MAAAIPIHAGQPLVTDEAAVVAPKTCQLEEWSLLAHAGREYWAQPACNFTGNVELSVGAALARPDGEESSSIVQLQAKTATQRTDGEWTFGMAAGAGRDTAAPHGSSAFQLYYAKALASWYPRGDLEIDLNLGVANAYGLGTTSLAGAAVQYQVAADLRLLAEIFHDEARSGRYQVGIRYIVIPNRFEAYVSYGNRINGPSSAWASIVGIRLQTPVFLP